MNSHQGSTHRIDFFFQKGNSIDKKVWLTLKNIKKRKIILKRIVVNSLGFDAIIDFILWMRIKETTFTLLIDFMKLSSKRGERPRWNSLGVQRFRFSPIIPIHLIAIQKSIPIAISTNPMISPLAIRDLVNSPNLSSRVTSVINKLLPQKIENAWTNNFLL